jgi:lysophospholipase L1-like esterase
VDIRINSLGFRDLEHAFGKSPKKRVIILGDSFIAGFSVQFEATLARICEQYLDKNSAEQWEVINLGVAGFGTAQEMLAFSATGSKFCPDYVVLCFFAGNDVSDNSPELSNNPRPYFILDANGQLVKKPFNQLRNAASSFLNEYSRFYVWQKNQINKLTHYFKSEIILNPVHQVFLAGYDAKMTRAWEITRSLTIKLNSLVESAGAKLLVVYLPYSDEVNRDWWQETIANSPPMQKEKWDLDKPEKLISAICRENSMDFISPREFFLEKSKPSERYYFKHGHFNENGHRLVGQMIGEWVLKNTLPAKSD